MTKMSSNKFSKSIHSQNKHGPCSPIVKYLVKRLVTMEPICVCLNVWLVKSSNVLLGNS